MATKSWTKCRYSNGDYECETFFEVDGATFCRAHRGIPSTAQLANEASTKSFIALANNEALLVKDMTLDQVDAHIATLERAIEELKARRTGARSDRADKITKLSDKEREERRKMRFSADGTPEPAKVKRVAAQPKLKKPSFATDPIGYLMASHNLDRVKAEKMHKELMGL
jgi:hypothetical protein